MFNLLSTSLGSAIYNISALAIILIFALVGLYRGFAGTFLKIFGKIIALILSIVLCSYMANFLQQSLGLIDKVGSALSGVLTKLFGNELMNTSLETASNMNLEESGITKFLVPLIIKALDKDVPLDTTLNQIISPVFGYYVVCFLSAIILYILFRILIHVLCNLFKDLHKIKIFGITDKSLGFILGIIQGAIYIQIALMILQIIPIGFVKEFVNGALDASFVKFIYDVNIFKVILDALTKTGAIDFALSLINK